MSQTTQRIIYATAVAALLAVTIIVLLVNVGRPLSETGLRFTLETSGYDCGPSQLLAGRKHWHSFQCEDSSTTLNVLVAANPSDLADVLGDYEDDNDCTGDNPFFTTGRFLVAADVSAPTLSNLAGRFGSEVAVGE